MSNALCPFGPDLQKYWDRRYDLFSRFDEGIQIDQEGLYSAMPESIANAMVNLIPTQGVIDAMCGLGGFSIANARAGKNVMAIDIDPKRLAMAQHNASIYGVADRINFVCADIFDYMQRQSWNNHTIFFDPPWGGPDYSKKQYMMNKDFSPALDVLVQQALDNAIPTMFNVPKNYNLNELSTMGDRFAVRKHHMWDRHIFSTILLS